MAPSRIAFILSVAVFAGAAPAVAAEGIWHAWALAIAETEHDRPSTNAREDDAGQLIPGSRLELRLDSTRLAFAVGLAAEVEISPGVLAFGAVDTGPLEWQPDGGLAGDAFVDGARRTWLVRAAGVEIFAAGEPGWSLVVGKQRLQLGRGVLIDAPALGIDAAVDGNRFGLRLGAWWLGRDAIPEGWPVVRGVVEWRPDPLTHVRLIGATTRFDGARGARLLEPAIVSGVERVLSQLDDVDAADDRQVQVLDDETIDRLLGCADYTASMTPWWFGVEAETVLEGHTLSMVGLVGGGRGAVELSVAAECPTLSTLAERLIPPRRFALTSAALVASWRARLMASLYTGLRGLAFSGHSDPETGRLENYSAFVAPAPLIARPALLLDGGLLARLADRPAVSYGYDGRGLLTVGPHALFVPHDTVEIDVAWLPAWSGTEMADGARFYGHEIDARLRWQPFEYVAVTIDGAALWPGEIFGDGGPWWRLGATVEGQVP